MIRVEWRFPARSRPSRATHLDGILAALAEAQHGVVHRNQLLAAGVSDRSIRRLLETGRLIGLHRNVYAVGHRRLRPEGHRTAAVFAAGEGGRLAGLSAAEQRGLVADLRARVDVIVPPGSAVGRKLPGLTVHRCALPEQDRDEVDGIPTTSVSRTFVDVAAWAPRRRAARAIDQAMVLGIYDQWAVDEILRRPGRLRGAAVVRSILEERHPDAHLSRSELESRAVERLTAAGLRGFGVNVWVTEAAAEVDLLWRAEGLAVELDGRRYHWHREHLDRAKDRRLRSAGLRVARHGWGDATAGPFPEMIRDALSEG